MTRQVLITGATGTLGHRVVGEATEAGHKVRALSRRDHVGYTGVHWQQGDLLTGDGIDAALDGIEVVVHCATQGTRGKDVASANNLIAAARRAGVDNIIYVSIVGHRPHPAAVLQGQAARRGSVGRVRPRPHDHPGHAVPRPDRDDVRDPAILAALFAIKGVRFQPIDTRDVATHLVSLIDDGPAGRVDDIGGPAVYDHDELGRMYLAARNSRRRVLSLPVPGGIVAALKSGANLVPANPVGTIGFAQHLARTP